ncbi:CrcB family protein [Cyanobium sp. Morenito 9A2]|uniref:FluC/FEX family fluoride channel n=1 Tax=Cyanobium sp. Morenito 9A2 TaxID=2823718 RepID=UPI0020CD909B|nr:CrcB family protein [Cyanobium sp. Morenito 9A2]MCP9850216.1 CrcB family protein [Cyanobium sp. Morenito 9A2]
MNAALRFDLKELALVGAGAVPGALLRWQAVVQLGPVLGGSAGANLLVNLVGSFLLGILVGPLKPASAVMLLLGIGFCGSLTTFSSWMLDVVRLQQQGHGPSAVLLVAASLGLGLLAAGLGQATSRSWIRPPGPPRWRR